MIINMHHATTTSLERQKLVAKMIEQFRDHYNVSKEMTQKLFFGVIDSGPEQTTFLNFMRDTHKLKITPWSIGDIAKGFELEEDKHFTVWMLT